MGKKIIIIPVRMDSKRLPGKPLLEVGGKALVHWVYMAAKKTSADNVIVTAPDRDIGKYCQANELLFYPSSDQHENGTQRCAEVLDRMKVEVNTVVNWQGDEPCVDPKHVDRMMRGNHISTLVSPATEESLANPNDVKVTVSRGFAFWFSRAPMAGSMIHTGVYCFPHTFLVGPAELSPTALSQAESLEQLGWVERGLKIEVFQMEHTPLAINCQEDFDSFRSLIETAQNVGKE